MPFILRRLAFYLVAAWVALTANFFIPRAVPGNAVQNIMDEFPNQQPSAYKALEAMAAGGPLRPVVPEPVDQPVDAAAVGAGRRGTRTVEPPSTGPGATPELQRY